MLLMFVIPLFRGFSSGIDINIIWKSLFVVPTLAGWRETGWAFGLKLGFVFFTLFSPFFHAFFTLFYPFFTPFLPLFHPFSFDFPLVVWPVR